MSEPQEIFQQSADFEDDDTCTYKELQQYFKVKYKLHDETSVTSDDADANDYILCLAKDDQFKFLAVGISNGSVRVIEMASDKGLYVEAPCSDNSEKKFNICGLRFLDETPNLLLVGTTNGLVRLLDLRMQVEVMHIKNQIRTKKLNFRNILCFDRSANSHTLCVGTEEYNNDVHLLFNDLRSCKNLFFYTESHCKDVNTVRFHPNKSNILCSGSTDGLINIYDINKNNEVDALFTTINTDSSVNKINWHKGSKGSDIISCITYTNDFKSYEFQGDLLAEFDRFQITEQIKRKSEANCSLINCHNTADKSMMLLTGSNADNGEIVRSLMVKNNKLLPFACFEKNNQIVRDSILDTKTNVLITGGESGIVTLWTPQSEQTSTTDCSSSSSLKCKIRKKDEKKSVRNHPY